MINCTYQPPTVKYNKRRKNRTIPDQSMSIKQIVEKYVRGIPVDVVKRQPVYIDQSQHDLEALSRMDFAEKAELAEQMRGEAQAMESQLNERERTRRANEQQARTTPAQAPAEPKA